MDPILCISPHLDDVCLSMGQVLAGRPDAIVATICTGYPGRGAMLTTYDRDCGFDNARQAIATRIGEDRAAVEILAARSVHLGFLDHQYRRFDEMIDEEQVVDRLVELVDQESVGLVVGPLGLAHPDHAIATRVLIGLLIARPGLEGWVYEDLPSRVLWPEQVPAALAGLAAAGFEPALGFLGTGPLDVKEKAIACYRTQTWALDQHAILCPERLHRLWRNDA